jgi:hypothetical protein
MLHAAAPVGARQRRFRLGGLALLVTALHLVLASQGLPARLGAGDADHAPRRMEVAFVRELVQASPVAPPAAQPRPAPRLARLPSAPAQAASAASAPEAAKAAPSASLPEPTAATPIEPTPPIDLAAVEPIPQALVPLAPTPAAPTPPALDQPSAEWPPSTRLSYTLTGNYRGPVQGQARVEWLRSGTRYQVHMDLSVGPSFAPLMARRVSSEGEITALGLQPHRYDEETRVALRQPRRLTVFLDADQVRLPAGGQVPRPVGVQDSASQFVQLTWLFTMQPELLQPGRSVELPLALPRVVETWSYEVLDTEQLQTPAGVVSAVHVKPRRPPRPGNDLVAEFWAAPSLQYLPVRILIRQDADTYVDLIIDQLPQQAEAGK